MKENLRIAVCYRLNNPVIYSRGTPYETRETDFLAYYTFETAEEAQKTVDMINTTKPERLPNNVLAHCDERVYYINQQADMY